MTLINNFTAQNKCKHFRHFRQNWLPTWSYSFQRRGNIPEYNYPLYRNYVLKPSQTNRQIIKTAMRCNERLIHCSGNCKLGLRAMVENNQTRIGAWKTSWLKIISVKNGGRLATSRIKLEALCTHGQAIISENFCAKNEGKKNSRRLIFSSALAYPLCAVGLHKLVVCIGNMISCQVARRRLARLLAVWPGPGAPIILLPAKCQTVVSRFPIGSPRIRAAHHPSPSAPPTIHRSTM